MKRTLSLLLLAASALLVGCAGLRSVPIDVSSFGDWPAERKPGSYAFERLLSQQARAADTDVLELAARGALLKAGFVLAADATQADVLVQVGTRSGRPNPGPRSDGMWWGGGYGYGYYRFGPWIGSGWGAGAYYDTLRYDREVVVLIRDRASGRPLFEARAANEGNTSSPGTATLAAMFDAAMLDFPRLGVNPRRVVIELPN